MTPSTWVRLDTRLRARRLVRYPCSRQIRSTRSRVSGRISGASFSARETVVTETPASLAMSLMVTRAMDIPPFACGK